MNRIDLDELRQILRAHVWDSDEVDLDGDIADIEFSELGYDSLAVLEVCGQVERRYGVQISAEAVAEMPTPARAVAYINDLLEKAGA